MDILFECVECGNKEIHKNGKDGIICSKCGGYLHDKRFAVGTDYSEAKDMTAVTATKKGIHIQMIVDTSDMDDALIKIKELNDEMEKYIRLQNVVQTIPIRHPLDESIDYRILHSPNVD
jgi:transcription initiation factor TFIIIB Brf1 subunit/transcription initiation factor TFIIB